MVDASANVVFGQLLDRTIDFSVDLAPNLKIPNPIMISSGVLGYEYYEQDHVSSRPLSQLGAVVPKTTTLFPRDGNIQPRQFPADYGKVGGNEEQLFLNSFGLNNPGIETVIGDWVPRWAQWHTTIIISIAGFSLSEFREVASVVDEAKGIHAIEVNLSCPNVEDRAIFSHDPNLARSAIAAVREKTRLPILAKLAPNVPDISVIAEATVDGGADALTICNTMPAMDIDLRTASPVLGNIYGGLSGPSLRPISLALVYETARALEKKGKSVPIIGVGGISKAEHALKYILAGASAVQIGTANWVRPGTAWRVLEGLQAYMTEHGISSISELRGAAHPATVGKT